MLFELTFPDNNQCIQILLVHKLLFSLLRTRTIPISDILFEETKSADFESFVFQPERIKVIVQFRILY